VGITFTQNDWVQIPAEDRALLDECNVWPVLVDDYQPGPRLP